MQFCIVTYMVTKWNHFVSKILPAAASPPEWEEVVLEQQQLWTGIDSYYRTPGPTESVGPVLSFRSAKGGLGDPGTMASIAARFHPRATDVHIVTCEAAGKSFIPFCCSDEGLASWFNHSATPPAVGCSGWVQLLGAAVGCDCWVQLLGAAVGCSCSLYLRHSACKGRSHCAHVALQYL